MQVLRLMSRSCALAALRVAYSVRHCAIATSQRLKIGVALDASVCIRASAVELSRHKSSVLAICAFVKMDMGQGTPEDVARFLAARWTSQQRKDLIKHLLDTLESPAQTTASPVEPVSRGKSKPLVLGDRMDPPFRT